MIVPKNFVTTVLYDPARDSACVVARTPHGMEWRVIWEKVGVNGDMEEAYKYYQVNCT